MFLLTRGGGGEFEGVLTLFTLFYIKHHTLPKARGKGPDSPSGSAHVRLIGRSLKEGKRIEEPGYNALCSGSKPFRCLILAHVASVLSIIRKTGPAGQGDHNEIKEMPEILI